MADEERHDGERPAKASRPAPDQQDRAQPVPGKPAPEEQVGRTLGRLFGRVKRSATWKRSERAYRDAVEGKDEEPSGR